ncbi:MAG: DUF4118 domain-containing protein [Gemmatimonadaceae bacterium]
MKWPTIGPYLVGMAATIVIAWVRTILDPLLDTHYPNMLFILGLLLTTRLGGWKPGLFVLVSSYFIADYLFTNPRHVISVMGTDHQIGAVMFLVVGISAIFLCQSERDVRARIDKAHRDLMTNHKELERGQTRYRSIVEALGEIVTINDLNGEITANENWSTVTGQS